MNTNVMAVMAAVMVMVMASLACSAPLLQVQERNPPLPTAAKIAKPTTQPLPTAQPIAQEIEYIATCNLNIRANPAYNSNVVGWVMAGTQLTITAQSGIWYKVMAKTIDASGNGNVQVEGYVHSKYVTIR